MAELSTKPAPPWRRFELIVAQIQRQLAPDANIRDNQKIKGKSGRTRQFDVLAEQKIGLVNVAIAFECKRYRRPVSIDKVEAFIGKLHDVGIAAGVMVSEKGFDAGAKARAANENILLFTCREAEEADWKSLVGEDAWLNILFRRYTIPSARVNWAPGTVSAQVTLESVLWVWSEDAGAMVEIGSLRDTITNTLDQIPTRIGTFTTIMQPIDPTSFLVDGSFRLVASFELMINTRAAAYPRSLKIGDGWVLRQVDDTAGFMELTSEAFDWRGLMDTVQGTELNQEEYEQVKSSGGNCLTIHNVKDLKRYLRIVVSQSIPAGSD